MAISQNFPDLTPSLNLNFAGSKKLDSRVTFTRGSTGTYMDDNGIIKTAGINQPRFDHSYNGTSVESLGLLIEESRSNIVLQSEAFDTTWTNLSGNATITANAIAAPDGATTADLVDNNGQAVSLLEQGVTVSASSTNDYYVTIFAKKGTSDGFTFNCYYVGNTEDNVTFNFTAGTVSGVPYSGEYIFQQYPNGWYRCGFRMTRDSTGTRTVIAFRMWESIRGNTTGSTYFWGAQLEAGKFATSYIPTTSSTATRSADNASITGTNFSDWFNPTEGTINIAYRMGLKTANTRIFQINNGSSSNVLDIVSGSGGGSGGYFFVNTNNVSQGQGPSVVNSGYENTIFKVAGAYKENDLAAANNKTDTLFTDNTATLPSGLNRVIFGQYNFSSLLCGHLLNVSYYPKRLTNTELQNLTK